MLVDGIMGLLVNPLQSQRSAPSSLRISTSGYLMEMLSHTSKGTWQCGDDHYDGDTAACVRTVLMQHRQMQHRMSYVEKRLPSNG